LALPACENTRIEVEQLETVSLSDGTRPWEESRTPVSLARILFVELFMTVAL
jgi:hypothetical protein